MYKEGAIGSERYSRTEKAAAMSADKKRGDDPKTLAAASGVGAGGSKGAAGSDRVAPQPARGSRVKATYDKSKFPEEGEDRREYPHICLVSRF